MKRTIAGVLIGVLVTLVVVWLFLRGRVAPDRSARETDRQDPSAQDRGPRSLRPESRNTVPTFDETPALRGKIAELTAEREAEKQAQEKACVGSVSSTCPFLAPSSFVLREMARCGVVRMDMPAPPSSDPEKTGAPDEEGQVRQRFWEQVRPGFEQLHRELVKTDTAPADLNTLFEEIRAAIPMSLTERIHRSIARERAGLAGAPPPMTIASLPAPERFWRKRVALGDDYENMLAAALGNARARTLREQDDGWPFKGVMTGPCEP